MHSVEVVVAGAGISGLLIASILSKRFSVILLEQQKEIPRNRYWLTSHQALIGNDELSPCINTSYTNLDFISYTDVTARIYGKYLLWDTDKLINHLLSNIHVNGGKIFRDSRLYSYSTHENGLKVYAGSRSFFARLMVDCMGVGSPIAVAKNIFKIAGYYILHGREVSLKKPLEPVALHNVMINRNPSYIEIFPTAKETAHAALIIPARTLKPDRSIRGEFEFILKTNHYSDYIYPRTEQPDRSFFGIIPVGRLRTPSIDRMVFFGEAGQMNPAASATGLTRMLCVYKEYGVKIGECLDANKLSGSQLAMAMPKAISKANRIFQEGLFDTLLAFNSDDFCSLVHELRQYPDHVINDLIFADFNFGTLRTMKIALSMLIKRNSILPKHIARAIGQSLINYGA